MKQNRIIWRVLYACFFAFTSWTTAEATQNLPDNFLLRNIGGESWAVFENDAVGGMAPGDSVSDRNGTYGLQGPGEIAHLADINGDGLDDMVNVWEGPGFWRYGVRYTEASGELGSSVPIESANFDLATDTIKFGDIDNDGIDDVLGLRSAGFDIEWFARLSNGNAGFADSPVISAKWGDLTLSDVGFLGDMNGDGVDDRLLQRPSGAGYEVFLDLSNPAGGWGDNSAEPQTWVGGDNTTDQMTAADLNGDGVDDLIIVRDSASDGIGTGTYEFIGFYGDGLGLPDGLATPDITFSLGDIATEVPLFGQVETTNSADFDGSGFIDGNDFLIWQRGYLTGSTFAEGDANGDTAVDGADLAVWEAQYGTSLVTASINQVPEPSSLALIVLAGLLSLKRLRGQLVAKLG